MLQKTYDSQICSLARALELVGERWSLLIVRDALFAGVTRFNDFQHNLGIATNVLASRLEAFVDAGIMERREVHGSPRQHTYALTAKGRDLAPTLVALTSWGDRWATDGEPPILFHHADCGAAVGVETTCARCGAVGHDGVQVAPGPGMPAEYLADRRPARPPQP
ncbi:winged helix-turn-helix transcriptional regulator [Mumia sp. Pv 4-285]|uniref:winged helix-turn-helix transcriptional regulator n=1 Tax=Mumia qirimensis TaxID=3234852 RepID=UPI00351D76D7